MMVEFEAYWSFPVFELVLFVSLLSILNMPFQPTFSLFRPSVLNNGIYGLGIMLQMLVIGVLMSRSFAGSLGRRETNVLLSYPVKRTTLLASKFLVNFLLFFGLLAFGVAVNSYLLGLSFLEPAPYLLIGVIGVQVFFLCSLSLFVALLLKSEVISIFAFLLLMSGLEFSPVATGGWAKNLTQIASNGTMYQYLVTALYGKTSGYTYTFQDFSTALSFSLLTGLLLLALSLIYFRWGLQID
jgi:ABC-type transport system involved in multi-copper enzyme maturation permease subunit